MLFAINVDVLIQKLEHFGLGCYTDNIVVGALGYADDITIISPSTRVLNSRPTLRVCGSYAEEYSLIFNEQKSVAIKFGKFYKYICTVVLNGKQVGWKDGVKHLGNAISSDLFDRLRLIVH